MKIARVFLLAALLLSAFSTTALAPDEAVGFVQLVPRPDPNSPISIQTHQALQQLRPELLAAQRAGQIIRYDVSPHSGLLMIVYRGSSGLAELGGKTIYSQMEQAIPAATQAQMAASRDALTCSAPKFQLYLYDIYFEAGCLTPGALVIGSLRDPAGMVVAAYSGTVDAAGNLPATHFSYSSLWDVVPGYTVTFKEYVGGTLAAAFQSKAPNLKFTSIDKGRSIVRGTGPAGRPIHLYWQHEKWDAGQTTVSASKDRTITASRTWQVDFGTIPIRGRDLLTANVDATANLSFFYEMYVPYTYCEIGRNYCELTGFAFTPATIQIVHGGQTYTFSGTSDEWGWFWAELYTPTGAPIFLVTWDKVSGTGVAQYALPNLTANVNATTDIVSGKAPAYKYLYITVYAGSLSTPSPFYAHSNGSGNYSVNLMTGYGVDLLPGRPCLIYMRFVLPSTGNETIMRKGYGP